MTIATCVKTNGSFTLFDEYEVDDFYSDELVVMSDDGWIYIVDYQGDGYYGCIDIDGKEVRFLVE